jgi:hypothetical protein
MKKDGFYNAVGPENFVSGIDEALAVAKETCAGTEE